MSIIELLATGYGSCYSQRSYKGPRWEFIKVVATRSRRLQDKALVLVSDHEINVLRAIAYKIFKQKQYIQEKLY